MSLDLAGAIHGDSGGRDAAPGHAAWQGSRALLRPLAQLGPVLLVCGPGSAATPTWRLRSCIDSDGVQECLELGAWRLYRLPDSDFLGWERLGALCACEGRPEPAAPRRSKRASLAQAGPNGWEPLRRLSPLGWDLAQRILQREAAVLCDAVWRE